MKAALQEEAEGEEGDVKRVRDAKGREILTEEEKAQKEEKERKKAAEVCLVIYFIYWVVDLAGSHVSNRERPRENNVLKSWSRISKESLGFSPNQLWDQMIQM